jgi:uncharacterized lipoprotein YddW (UPF0748 family)
MGVLSVAEGVEPRYGLWVEVEGKNQPFVSKKSLDEALRFIEDGGFTDIYCQIYRRGKAWFPSMMADDRPYRKSLEAGFDPLKEILAFAHARDIRVHAWLNALRIKDNINAPMFSIVGAQASHIDNYGNSLLAYRDNFRLPPGKVGRYFQLDTPGVWLDPANPQVRSYLVEIVRDLLVAYPELDGVHLDMLRYSFGVPIKRGVHGPLRRIELGYSELSVESFKKMRAIAVGPDTKTSSAAIATRGQEWDSWRRSQITTLVAQVRELVNSLSPHISLSVAAIANPDRAYRRAFQDWKNWDRQGLLTEVLPMAYTKDHSQLSSYARHAVKAGGNSEVLIGLGAWLMLRQPNALLKQVQTSLEQGADGVVLFSYSNMLNSRGRKLAKQIGEKVRSFRK